MHNNLFTTTILILFLFSSSSAALGGGVPHSGGWNPIPNVTDPTVVDIGKFAVDEHNKQDRASLKFGKVVKGEQQVVAGMNYNLTITATTDGSADKSYVALVYDKPWEKFRQLLSFKGPV